jgi:predicted pyridoxine 5'-phosphate oxidase superfamily flavin-nucleotide-binding protein
MAGSFYHQGHRELQDQFESRRIADRLESFSRLTFAAGDRELIENALFFFLATADQNGQPDCSFKGGPPGFVRLTGPSELAFPDYDGNGMFRSLGNVMVNPQVALLFIAMDGAPHRLRVLGTASIRRDDPLRHETVGAQMLVRVSVTRIFPNCPRYIPTMQVIAPSRFTPIPDCEPVEPEWKSMDIFEDVIHPRQPTWKG